ncbi:glycosyltransferase [Sporocytophaga myxococcoides]|nr:glycosyltransferase [Sporocytophaga myxococcoides]
MIRNKNILCMALTTWDKDFVNTVVKMMSILSKQNRILFVDYEYTVKDILAALSGKQKVPVTRIIGLENRLRTVNTVYGSEIHVLTPPPVLPINWIKNDNPYRVLLKLNGNLVRGAIQRALKTLKMENPIVVNGYNPFFGLPLVGDFNELLNIYYCYDEIKGDQWYHFHGPEIEKEYIKKTDAVITTSDALFKSKSPLHQNCFVVKNGVDFDHFNSIADLKIKSPHAPRIVGYTGSIDERFDYELLSYSIKMLPEVQFQFIGRVTNEIARMALKKYPNARFMGSRKPYEIPSLLKDMDVGIIPYLKNEVTSGVYPLKINEYMAAGKPVVMTDFAKIPEFESHVWIANNKEAFLNSLRDALYNDSVEKMKARIEFSKHNSWENRVEQFSSIVERMLELKKERVI